MIYIDKIIKVGLFLLFFFLPLIHLPYTFNPYENPKFIFFIVVVQILVVVYFLRWVISRFTPEVLPQRLLRGGVFDLLSILIVSFAIVVFIANIFGIDPKISFLGSEYRHQGFITLLAGIFLYFLLRCKDNPCTRIILVAILSSAFFVSLFALWQGIGFYIFNDLSIPIYQGRIVGTLGNPNFLGGYLAMILPLFLFHFSCHPEFISGSSSQNIGMLKQVQHDKKIKLIFTLLILSTILLTGSRSAILAVGIILFIFAIIKVIKFFRFIFTHLRGTHSKFLLSGLGVLVIVVVILGTTQSEAWGRTPGSGFWASLSTLSSRPKGQNDINLRFYSRDSMWDNRNIVWSQGLNEIVKRPILGYGQENYELLFPLKRMIKVDSAHNIFLEVLVSSGVTGLSIFLAIIFIALKNSAFPIKLSLIAFLIVASFNPVSIAQLVLFWGLLAMRMHANPNTANECE